MARKRVARKKTARAKRTVKKSAVKPARKSTRKAAKRTAKKRVVRRPAAKKEAAEGLLTLTEVSRRTGISMPTLQRYKKEYQRRLKTVGKGRTQRYKVESLETFKRIKKENLKKRGRPRKSAAPMVARPATRAKAAPEGLISLSEIGRRTGISYPTLLRYVRLHGRKIPSHGTGRKRRFPVEAVPVFAQLRKESRRGRRKGSPAKKAPAAARGLETRLRRLEKSQAGLEKQMKRLVKALQRPLVKGI
jgi:predicted DNA-binding transcriptional regulator AlpA